MLFLPPEKIPVRGPILNPEQFLIPGLKTPSLDDAPVGVGYINSEFT